MSDSDLDAQAFLPLTDLTFHVLLALGSGPLHGYAIGKDIEVRSSGRLRPTTGSLYQALRRIHRDGLIEEAQASQFPSADARRQYFQLTDFGREVFALEAKRLEALLTAARSLQLLPERA
ncbi:MAG: helix-turn-helix transcriptional regulator [bacterium]|nr:helix-turn-helix transcriptional regulator [bacterium]